jgi:5-(carboxyamino)imidazole ribonucleotide synthase
VTKVIPPGAALGVLGSGQLGRMFAIAARRMGYHVHTFSPESDTPAGQAADVEVVADYEDLDALRAFARQVDVVTFEFENVPIDAIDAIEAITPVRPCGVALHTAQQRAREKRFLADRGFPTAPFGRAATLDELWDAVARVGTPSVIKTAAFGYDGKGQHKVTTPADVEHIWTASAIRKRWSRSSSVCRQKSPSSARAEPTARSRTINRSRTAIATTSWM